MTIVNVKIHPAIGIARVGNSPDEFFIGPELPWDRTIPAGGYKDDQCRVKRQAARFRIFAYHSDGSVIEITKKEANITWTVHIANKKASVKKMDGKTARNPKIEEEDPPIDPNDLIIDPGARDLVGPDQRQVFDTGQIKLPGASPVVVPLGEARTDDLGRLLILGGFGQSKSPTSPPQLITHFYDNTGWYDDTSDGKVTATVSIRETGETFDAEGAWVLITPPKFAPGIDNVITLYDRLFDMAVKENWLKKATTISYTNDIYPILERARNIKWVVNPLGAHTWPHPVIDSTQRANIFARLSGGDMPKLNSTSLTDTQMEGMEKWNKGEFTNDWTAPPTVPLTITPEGLDKAALENAVGGAFFPGIEVGGITECPINKPSNFIAPFRLNHKMLEPGDLTSFMAVPWQADFKSCADYWWPVPRPNKVFPQGEVNYQDWDRDAADWISMVNSWHTLGFVIKQGNDYVEVDRCAGSFVTLLTPNLNFEDITEGPMGMRHTAALAIVFEVKSTDTKVTLEFQFGPKHPRLVRISPSVTVGPTTGNTIATAKLWVTYETGYVGEVLNDEAVIRNPANNQTWNVVITANTIGRKPAALAVVLDRSASMSDSFDNVHTKRDILQVAVSALVDTVMEGDGVAIVSCNEQSHLLQSVTALGSPADSLDIRRTSTKNILLRQELNPYGATSIGEGIHKALEALNSVKSTYDNKTLILLTDGKENREPWIADLAGKINLRLYSVILGLPQNTNVPALQAIAMNHGCYLINVEDAVIRDKYSVVTKYVLQILASITNADVVVSTSGDLLPGLEHCITFSITEADMGMDIILLSHHQQYIEFRLQTPNGFIIEPRQSSTRLLHVSSDGISYYRIMLPVEMFPRRFDWAGTWRVLLNIKQPNRDPYLETQSSISTDRVSRKETYIETRLSQGGSLNYALLIHAYSNLSFRPSLQQSSYEPGSVVSLYATLCESGIPLKSEFADLWAEVTSPDGSYSTVALGENRDSQFTATFQTTTPGTYRFRMRVSGRSRLGHSFQREHTFTSAVWYGANNDTNSNNIGAAVRLMRNED